MLNVIVGQTEPQSQSTRTHSMSVFIIRRLGQAVLVLFFLSLLIFLGVYVIGNPVDLLVDPNLGQAAREQAARQLGLDRPIWEQYFTYLANAAEGDFGRSFVYNQPALKIILDRMPATFELATVALAISIVLGIPLGIIAGYFPNRPLGRAIMAGSIFGFSLPSFWVGLMLIMFFAVYLGWLPSGGRGPTRVVAGVPLSFVTWEGFKHLILPALNLALFVLSFVIRVTSASVRETLPQDFIKYARAKGLSTKQILLVHVLRNILIPVVTIIGLEFGGVLAFSVVTENVFAWPGMGKLLVDAISVLDRPIIVAYLLIVAIIFLTINLVVDVLYALIDPRVRLTAESS
jgi:peptide/nickel transport system permease protein